MIKKIIVVIACITVLLSSCDPISHDITIINSTPDSLYCFIQEYKSDNEYKYNFAYDAIAAHDTAAKRYDIAYNINAHKFLPHDTIHPMDNDWSWKRRTAIKDGLTLLFYKRDIQQLAEDVPLGAKNIYRRFDLTISQLDSLEYNFELK